MLKRYSTEAKGTEMDYFSSHEQLVGQVAPVEYRGEKEEEGSDGNIAEARNGIGGKGFPAFNPRTHTYSLFHEDCEGERDE